MIAPQVALSKGFMESYSKLPRTQQKKVRDFTEKFQRDPTAPGINFERIAKARDEKVRSVRIDQECRAIVVHPPRGDVYLCVWVDHHDAAYRWAQNKMFEVNPRSGSFQLFDVAEVEALAPAVEAQIPGLLDAVDDEDLLLAGVPSVLLASVRDLKTEQDLEKLAPHVPAEAAEMLYYLAAGYSLLEAIEESHRSKPEPEKVDTEDFTNALSKPESQITFKIVENEEELEEMLDAPLEQWRIFLHPSQRKLVRMNSHGPVRVLGGAGTGKTVVMMHRARHLLREVFTGDDDRILVTTFTRNLALDLAANLRNLCGGKDFGRLEVTNIHSWAVGFMRRLGHSFSIVSAPMRDELFQQAFGELASGEYPLSFYMDEWAHVVQAQDVRRRDFIFTARRVGRGIRLTRKQRAEVWKVLERYRQLLEDRHWVEWDDVIRETRQFLIKQGVRVPYRAVLVDEVQDMTPGALKLLRAMAPEGEDSLFLVGDGHQRIYGKPVTLSSCGIEIRGRARRLRLNYRTTAQIRQRAVALLEGIDIDDLDGGVDDLKGYHSLRQGPVPQMMHFERESKEGAAIVKVVQKWLDEGVPPRAICLAARHTAQLGDRYEAILEAAGIETVRLEKDPESEALEPGVRLATMHRMKGLEFSRVILAGVQDGNSPTPWEGPADDDIGRAEHELQERCLLYVASTRARDELVITGYGKESPFLTGGAS